MAKPSAAPSKNAIKILEQFDQLARKLGIKLPADRLEELENLRDDGTIRPSTDLPAKLRSEFPGEFDGMTLDEIREECGMNWKGCSVSFFSELRPDLARRTPQELMEWFTDAGTLECLTSN